MEMEDDLEQRLRQSLPALDYSQAEAKVQARYRQVMSSRAYLGSGPRHIWPQRLPSALVAVLVMALVALGSIGVVRLAVLRDHHLATGPVVTKHAVAPVAQAVGDWQLLSPATNPLVNDLTATMAYDAATGTVLLVIPDALAGQPYLSETWSWNGSNWTQLQPATSPPPIEDAVMAYDAANQTVVLFGGFVSQGPGFPQGETWSNQTWVWDGSNWTPMNPAASPPARAGAAMAYDPANQGLLLFGGCALQFPSAMAPLCHGSFSDTWVWNGSNWTQLHPAASPPAANGAAMAYDAGSGQMVLMGGADTSWSPIFNQTWVWNGTNWAQMQTATNPPECTSPTLAYDSALGQVVMSSGDPGSCMTVPGIIGTWGWNGTNWSQLATSGLLSSVLEEGAVMAYDANSQSLVGFVWQPTGQSSTWTWK